MSKLGWIDFSPDDRNKVRNVLAMLAEPGTLDELGIGQIRDAYSDLLFPGISTIQTRAKYFITVPRILRDFQLLKPAQKRRYKSVQKYLLDRENEVARILATIHDEDEKGIIGRTRIDSGGVDRRPSVIYWNGLRTFGLINTRLSLNDFCRHLDGHDMGPGIGLTSAELTEGSDDDDMNDRNVVMLPDKQSDWMADDKLSLNLTLKEAEFLKEAMLSSPEIVVSVPAQLFSHNLIDEILAENANSRVEAFDVLANTLIGDDNVDPLCKNHIRLAKDFSLAMEGPHLRYNIELAKRNEFDESLEQYTEDYKEWKEKVSSQKLFTENSANEWLWATSNTNRTIKAASQKFVRDCCDVFINRKSTNVLDDIVLKQAEQNKGPRSLLNRKLSDDHWMGIRRLDYRWSTARNIIGDIQVGLNAGA